MNETGKNKTSHKTCLGRQPPNKEVRCRPTPVAQRLGSCLPRPGTRAQSLGRAAVTAGQPPGLCATAVEAALRSPCSSAREAPR